MPIEQPMNSHRLSAVQWLVLGIIFILALYLRTIDLNEFGFWTDEQYHVIAAQSMLDDGKPNFPNGNHYVRGLPFTALVAGSFDLFGITEWSARLPSVVISLVFLVFAFTLTRSVFGNLTAIVFFAFLALSPTFIEHSRMSRFYSLYQLSFFLGAWLFYKGFEYDWSHARRKGLGIERFLSINLPLILISGFLILFACYFQGLSILFGISVLIYSAACLLIDRHTLINKYSLSILAAILFFILLFVLAPGLFAFAQSLVTVLLPWAQYNEYPISFYRWYLQENYLSILLLSQLGFVLLFLKDKKRAIYLNALFLGTLIILSLLAMKQHRYMLHILPFMFLLAAYGLTESIAYIKDKLDKNTSAAALTTPAVLLLFILSSSNTLIEAFKTPNNWAFIDWKAFFKQDLGISSTDIVISTNQNSLYYYFRTPDFYINSSYIEYPNPTETWVTDNVIIDTEDLLATLDTDKRIVLLTSKSRFNDPFYLSDELRQLIFERFDPVEINKYPYVLMMTSKPKQLESLN